ncbi:MAG TPA: phosphatase PAP2 family protein [Longimicrobiaceae bacterium]|nr:phosphatase PAP2 family protein [Longimicrobiaceae bacterium]
MTGMGGARTSAWRRRITAAWMGAALAAAPAAAQTTDSTAQARHIFNRTDVYVLGGLAVTAAAVRPLDTYLTNKLQNPNLQYSPVLGRGAATVRVLAVPGSLIGSAGFYAIGRARHDPAMSDVSLHTFEAVALTGVLTTGIKLVAGRARPYVDTSNPHNFKLMRGRTSDAYQSFPSGHTSTAFAAATALTAEAGEWRPRDRWIVGGVTYTLATLTGISRIYNNYHWASDVMAGAALGTVTGLAVVRYNHIHQDNSLNRKLIPKGNRGIPIVFSIPTR